MLRAIIDLFTGADEVDSYFILTDLDDPCQDIRLDPHEQSRHASYDTACEYNDDNDPRPVGKRVY